MPVHHSAAGSLRLDHSPVGTQIPAGGRHRDGDEHPKTDEVAMTFFGEGTSSTGEFHVG